MQVNTGMVSHLCIGVSFSSPNVFSWICSSQPWQGFKPCQGKKTFSWF